MRTARAFPLAAVAVTLLWPGSAAAQERDTARAAQDTVVPVYNLEKIEVTVTRIRSLVNRAPYALHVVDARAIQGSETTVGLEEALAEVAGVWVNNRHSFALGPRISIRGFGSRAQFGVRGVKMLLDGIPLTLPDGQSQVNNIDLATIGRVEVIRGPSSSLYGNAAGGVISFSTEQPPAVPLRPELSVLWGSFGDGNDFQKYVGKVGGRQGSFDYVGSLSHFRTDGFRQWSRSETTVFNGRGRWFIDGATELSAVLNVANTPVAQNPGSLNATVADTAPESANPGNVSQRTGEAARQIQGGLTLRRQLGATREIRISAWGLTRDLDNPIPPSIIRVDRTGGGARVEAELTPLGSPLTSVIGGIETELQRDARVEFSNAGGEPDSLLLDQDESVTAFAAFAQGAIDVGERWGITLGARYDAIRFEVDDHLILADTVDPDDSGSRTMSAFSPMLGVRFTPTPSVNLYANVTYSFETPTTSELKNKVGGGGGFNTELDPQRAWGSEIGMKGTVAERFDYALSGYWSWVTDRLISFQDTIIIDRDFFRNAGVARHRGIEAQVGWLVTEGLTLSANYTFSDLKFIEFVTESSDFGGNRIPGVPIHQAHGRLSYRSPMDVFGSLEVSYSDAYFTTDANTERNPDYALFDVRVGYNGRVGAWSLEPFVGINNLFDTRYNASVVVNQAFGGRFYEPGPGRTFYTGLRVPVRLGQ